jgi:hypothetical protein
MRFLCLGFLVIVTLNHVVVGFLLPNQFVLSSSSLRQSYNIKQSKTVLSGIRGFRAWFESQFPDAMMEISHDKSSRQSESFHHLLIDVNQLLHVTLRRARSEGHALTMLIQELDKCIELATPKKSVVLAFDGPPAAAKLATQRRRRYATVLRSERKKMRYEMLMQRGIIHDTYKQFRNRKAEKEEETLKITPGTEFMDKAHEAVLYWAWQRLDRSKSKLANVKIYISPSTVPGEGEVKLLDWLLQAGGDGLQHLKKRNERRKGIGGGKIILQGESVAIYGGDSDLVLEGLVIPPTITHNVFVILPSGKKSNYVVSLWQTTLTLAQFLGDNFDQNSIMRVRTDLVLLLIMNGNDYLPKLRGSSGFNKLFHTYLRLLKNSLEKGEPSPYLIDPVTLQYNLSFCKTFFQVLADIAPQNLAPSEEMVPYQQSITPLSNLYSMVDSGFLPQPAIFEKVPNAKADGKDIMRLSIGKSGTDKAYTFELQHTSSFTSLKQSKQVLANMALEEILGADYMEWNDCMIGNESKDDDEFDDEKSDYDQSGPRYSWEISVPAPGSVEEYLKGMIWNLASYQDGVCSDYGYNYGRRMSPTAEEMVSYLEQAENEGRIIDRSSLLGESFISPLNAGMSCLAALPSQVSHLIPQPYRTLSLDSSIDDIYGTCMSPEANVFDLESFRERVEEKIGNAAWDYQTKYIQQTKQVQSGRRVRVGGSFWTCLRRTRTPLVHQFEPPVPFSERLSRLRPNPHIHVSHIVTSQKPRWLRDNDTPDNITKLDDHKHIDMGKLLVTTLGDNQNLVDVGFKTAYQGLESNRTRENKKAIVLKDPSALSLSEELKRMRKFDLKIPPDEIPRNKDDHSAVQCLQQLVGGALVKSIDWEYNYPSHSTYAEIDPNLYEYIGLKIKLNYSDVPLLIGQDRNVGLLSRKTIKHLLADQAMSIVFKGSEQWQLMTTKELKSYHSPKARSLNAIQYLHHLRDAKLFQMSWNYSLANESKAQEIISLKIDFNGSIIELEESRNINIDSKSSTRHLLASRAMDIIVGDKISWKEMNILALKARLMK